MGLVIASTGDDPSERMIASALRIDPDGMARWIVHYNALAGGQYSSMLTGQNWKPLGASKPGVDTPPPSNAALATPSLFITLLDSVSGQILHRVSHAHALVSDIPKISNIQTTFNILHKVYTSTILARETK